MNYIFVLLSFVLLVKNEGKIVTFIRKNYKHIIIISLLCFCDNITEIYDFLTKIIE